jgi:hypothetical protein
MAYQEYAEGPDWGGAVLCDPATDSSCLAGGYKCTDTSASAVCFGRTGKQVLQSIHHVFDTFNSQDTFNTDVAILIGIAIICKIMFVVVMSVKARSESAIVPPEYTKSGDAGSNKNSTVTVEMATVA